MSSRPNPKPLSSLAAMTLRSRRSWMSWRRRRTEARLRRALRRQMLLRQMLQAEQRRVLQLEEQLFPMQVVRMDPPPQAEPPALTEAELLADQRLEQQVREELPFLLTPGLRPEPELPTPPPAEEQLAMELGWSLPPS